MLDTIRKTWREHKRTQPASKEIAVYGDSFVDPNCSAASSLGALAGDYWIPAWSCLLVAHYEPRLADRVNAQDCTRFPHVFGRSGVSNWYTYQRFLKNYHEYKRIVWVWTNKSRWPYLPESLAGHHFNVTNMHHLIEKSSGRDYLVESSDLALLEQMNQVYTSIYPEALMDFINNSIFLDVQRRCQDRGIALVNITIDDDYTTQWPLTDYPMFRGLNAVSWREPSGVDGELMRDIINERFLVEMRTCHLNTLNNQLLRDLVIANLDQNTACYKSLPDDYTWNWSVDPLVQKFYLNYQTLVYGSK